MLITAFAMAQETHDHPSSLDGSDHCLDDSSSATMVIIDIDSTSRDDETEASTVLKKIFTDVTTDSDGGKWAKCGVCKATVKQSSGSAFNYGRHIRRKHLEEFEAWKSQVESRRVVKNKKQPTIPHSFGQRGIFSCEIIPRKWRSVLVKSTKSTTRGTLVKWHSLK